MQTDAAPSRSITSDRVGFVGTGIMGGPMAMRLLDAGFALTVCDPNPAAIFSGTFKHSGPLFKGLKDAELFLEEAERLGAPVWVARSVVEIYRLRRIAGRSLVGVAGAGHSSDGLHA